MMPGGHPAARVLAVVAAALISGCYVPLSVPGEAPASPQPAEPEGEHAAVAAAVIEQANRTRAGYELAPLLADAALNRAALGHAHELARRGVLDHYSEDRNLRTPAQRIEAVGGSWYRVGENLASMSGPASNVPRRSIQLWLASPDHMTQLLGSYTHTGVGVVLGPDRQWYIVQLYTVPPRSGR